MIQKERRINIPDYNSFKRSIVITVVSLILLLIGFSIWKSVVEYRLTVRAAEHQSRGYARALKEHAERALGEADRILLDTIDHIKTYDSIQNESSLHLRNFANRHSHRAPQIGAIFLVNRDGLICAQSLDKPSKTVNVADREYFIHHRDNPQDATPFLSKTVKSRLNDKWTFTLSRAVRTRNGTFDGLVAVAFDMEYFQKLYSSLDLGNKGRILFIRKDGVLLMAEPFNENDFAVDFKKSHLIRTYLPRSTSGTFHIAGGKALLESSARIISYESLDNFPLIANANMGIDEITANWLKNSIIQAVHLWHVSVCMY